MAEAVKTVVTAGSVSAEPVEILTMTRVQIVGVRALRVYLQSVLGILTAGGVGLVPGVLPAEFVPLVVVALKLGAAPVTFSVLQNTLELLADIDSRFPKARA